MMRVPVKKDPRLCAFGCRTLERGQDQRIGLFAGRQLWNTCEVISPSLCNQTHEVCVGSQFGQKLAQPDRSLATVFFLNNLTTDARV